MKPGELAGGAVMRFAEELRAWRQVQGWSQQELGTKLGYSGSHVSSVERLERAAVVEFAVACDRAFQTPGTFTRIHADIAREAYPPWFSPFVHFEASATRIHNWDARGFTGLLQTKDYARCLIRAGHPAVSDAEADRDVAARIDRQKIFEREQPPDCWFVIGEAAFRSAFGDDAIMRAQIAHVAELVTHPYITIQVYPLTTPDCPGCDGPVTVFNFTEQATTGYAEGYEAGRVIETPAEVATLVAMFDRLRAGALSPRDSAAWIRSFREEQWTS